MMKVKKDNAKREEWFFQRYPSQMILLGILIFVAGIYRLFPAFWETYSIPILLIAAGCAIPPLFSLWKFWAGYGWQVGIAPGLALILMGGFILLFGYTTEGLWKDAVWNLFWVNIIALSLWFVFIACLNYSRSERWRDYRWILAPAVILLLFLFDTSWAQSTLSASSLKKSVFKSAPLDAFQVHVEYPSQILFNDTEASEIRLWITNASHGTSLEIWATGLLFAQKPISDTAIEWSKKLEISLDPNTNAIALMVQPEQSPDTNSRLVRLRLSAGGQDLETSDWLVLVESKRDSQIRDWKKNFLGAGSTVVTVVAAVFAGIKQLEEEKKRQRAEHIKQAISTFVSEAKNDLSKTLQEYLELIAEWDEWDRTLQEQFRKSSSSFVEKELWEALEAKTIDKIKEDTALLLQLCERIFKEQEKSVFTLLTLQSALRMEENSPRALLYLLKEHPVSINAAKIIAGAFPLDLKRRTIVEYSGEFREQIDALRFELFFLETENFPLQEQFAFHSEQHIAPDNLTAWLNSHGLSCSPFADAGSPFYSAFDGQLLADWAAPGFQFPVSSFEQVILKFENAWDAGAAVHEYCKAFQSNIRLKDDVFFAMITPGIVRDYESEHPRKLYLHALAEQWIWSLAEATTLFYSMNSEERNLIGRLLRWHDFSASITVHKISEIANYLQKTKNNQGKKIPGSVLENMLDWLSKISADDLRRGEINAVIGLRPSPKQRTVFMISSVDLNPHVAGQISFSLHQALSEQSDWLGARGCGLVSFRLGGEGRQTVSLSDLAAQCNIRVQKCSQEGNLVFNELFNSPGREPDAILSEKAQGSPGRMVRLGQKLLLQHIEKYPLDEFLHIEDLEALEV